ncbi:hypothetical protein L228DRAFT_245387 [Xylona heveae TC161]|uniref:Uncharacterized protein n=1 Tax=Xylona heveae (strain CBS 132557 / TC161) TaxID=1328760 RepID=A0A165I6H1_XYLHT|nr:hypothetical protein L228DRAFT_245387 [Xylona heveae TC161]KZF24454.1 hypothetical protein L228DRAFT_245387 [Xylona heveae TC161]
MRLADFCAITARLRRNIWSFISSYFCSITWLRPVLYFAPLIFAARRAMSAPNTTNIQHRAFYARSVSRPPVAHLVKTT